MAAAKKTRVMPKMAIEFSEFAKLAGAYPGTVCTIYPPGVEPPGAKGSNKDGIVRIDGPDGPLRAIERELSGRLGPKSKHVLHLSGANWPTRAKTKAMSDAEIAALDRGGAYLVIPMKQVHGAYGPFALGSMKPPPTFQIRAVVPRAAFGQQLPEPYSFAPMTPLPGGPGTWWFTGSYHGRRPEVVGVVSAATEEDALIQLDRRWGRPFDLLFMQERPPGWLPTGTVGGRDLYPHHT